MIVTDVDPGLGEHAFSWEEFVETCKQTSKIIEAVLTPTNEIKQVQR